MNDSMHGESPRRPKGASDVGQVGPGHHRGGPGHTHGTHAHSAADPERRADRASDPAHGADRASDPAHGADRASDPERNADPVAFWEDLYSGAPRWSGKVNASLARAVEGLAPGRALDLGCGEGGDALWLAERGWRATGIDLSETAIARAVAAAEARGLDPERARFVAGDLATWAADPESVDRSSAPFDLVAASFLQSPVELPRERILRAARQRTAVGGTLVLVSHAAAPSWAPDHPGDLPSPESELRALALDPAEWEILEAGVRSREATAPNGEPASLDDTVVIARRRA